MERRELTDKEKSIIYKALCDRSAYLYNAIGYVEDLMKRSLSETLFYREQRLKAELVEEKRLVDALIGLFI